ncbi:MAG: hypothetical protein WCC04_05610, partial [Terriglobales bacterium]
RCDPIDSLLGLISIACWNTIRAGWSRPTSSCPNWTCSSTASKGEIWAEEGVAKVDARRLPNRMPGLGDRPIYEDVPQFTVHVPFDGDPGVFGLSPSIFGGASVSGEIVGNELLLTLLAWLSHGLSVRGFRAAKSEAHSPIPKLELLGDLPQTDPFLLESDDLVPVYYSTRTTELLPRGASMPNSGVHSFPNQISFELSDRGDDREKRLTKRAGGVDIFSVRDEFYAK